MKAWRPIVLLLLAVGVVIGVSQSTNRNAASPATGVRGITTAKGFKWAPEYYPATNGVQRYKSLITGSEGQFLSNGVIRVNYPRIESFRPDGSVEWVVSAVEALVDMFGKTATGTNLVSFRTGDTNLYLSGRGFLWKHTNATIILSNQTYTWVNRAGLTNSPKK